VGVCHALAVDAIDVTAARAAWERAARELGIDVVTEGASLGEDAERVEVVALIREFGSEKGTVVLGQQHSAAYPAAVAQGFFPTIISPSYEDYSRDLFEETLNDLQWFGAGEPPAWYTGAAWG